MTGRATRGESGFSLAELVVVMAVIGIVTVLAVPMMMSYWRTSTLMAGAREFATALNGARELAIRENRNVCVTTDGTRLQYRLDTCVAATWKGPVTDSGGNIIIGGSFNGTVDFGAASRTSAGGFAWPVKRHR